MEGLKTITLGPKSGLASDLVCFAAPRAAWLIATQTSVRTAVRVPPQPMPYLRSIFFPQSFVPYPIDPRYRSTRSALGGVRPESHGLWSFLFLSHLTERHITLG